MSNKFCVGRRAAVFASIAALSAVGFSGVASAQPGVSPIGPGPSENTAGVTCIQQALHIFPADGKFGKQTYDVVKIFQKQRGLSVDGSVGAKTGDELLPSAPDGCIANVPSTYSTPNWVSTPRPGQSITQLTDHYLFEVPISEFLEAKSSRVDGADLNWSDNGCSVPTRPIWASDPGVFNFLPSCARHDFGYRNYKNQGRFTEANRQRIDANFKKDMNAECNKSKGIWAGRGVECRQYADWYYNAVRQFG